jgi:hypothetical protein
MNTDRVFKRLLLLTVALLIMSCGNSAPEQLVIKGLYLGMPETEAMTVAKQLTAQCGGTGRITYSPGISGPCNFVDNLIKLGIADGKINRISFDDKAVDILFNVRDMSAEQFAQEFCNANNLPPMVPDSHVPGFSYTSEHGYKVAISRGKTIYLEMVAKPAERNFN